MPRKSRIEFTGAHYPVINRGNYKDWIFKTEGAQRSFLECLKLCCEAQGWELSPDVASTATLEFLPV